MAAPPNHAAWTPLVVCPHAGMAQRILAVLRELALAPGATLGEYPRMGSIAAIAQSHGCDICFLDAATNPEHAQVLIGELAPAVPVVALHTRADADLILRCLRGGACEFLTDPDAGALRNLFTRLGRVRALTPEPAGGTVYTVIPGKGGSGASTVAAHLAIYIGAIGATVLLVDGDSLSASLAFLLKLKAEYHLGDVLRDWKRMDQDLWARMTIRACGIDVLAAPANPAVRIEVVPAAAAQLCAFWRERYQVVVLDMAEARSAAETGFLGLSDQVLLVSGTELGSLSATRRAMEYLDQSMTDRSRLRLILNRCSPSRGLKPEDVRSALGVEPYAALDDDWPALQTAVLEGRPAPMSSRFSSGVEALCRQLRNQAAPGGSAKRNGSWLSLLRHRK